MDQNPLDTPPDVRGIYPRHGLHRAPYIECRPQRGNATLVGSIYPEKRGFAGPDKSLTATRRNHHGDHPVYPGNDKETF